MKKVSILSLLLLMGAAPKMARKVISLGEIHIQGEVERPTVTFVIPRARFDFLNKIELSDKKNWKSEITESLKNDIFQVK